ncbi:hypothetical protein AVEN_50077-1 [Araneus ventricosus]|uniref:RNase H type-1 domain-containing protein n=1 Tax=Araneus ventricosus TaxID=182803 RepID=A0A4Y2GBT4_ARAVE|nr:hypothetical protein AVEN_50077-1 [Araneus ventricosus]
MAIIEKRGELNKLRFSPQKTVMLPITFRRRLSLVEPPEVKLYGQSISAAAELTYLGMIWDGGLTFHSHFKERKVAMDSLTYRLTLSVCKWYSKQPSLLKTIYKCALEPKALFGHGAWGHRLKLKTFCDYLNVVQRRPLLAMTNSYRTSSTAALQGPSRGAASGSESVKKLFLFLFRIDGSGINDRIGAAMVVLYFGQLIHSERVRLGDNCTVYQAELVGLKLAAEFILTLTTTRRVNFYSDSRSALQSIADPTNTHPLVGEVKRLLKRVRSERGMFLHWVKAHVGYHGNELADGEAKAAADSPSVSLDLPVSSSRLKCKLRALTIQAWQDHWDFLPDKGRHTLKLFPRVSLRRHLWGGITELLTGHGRFPAILFRFGIGYDDRCACGAVGDAMHYMVSCPLTGGLRSRLRFNPLERNSSKGFDGRRCSLTLLLGSAPVLHLE